MEASSPSVKLQMKAMIKRTLLLKRRNVVQAYQEICLPIIFMVVLLVIPNDVSVYKPTSMLPTWMLGSSQPIPFFGESTSTTQILAYAPANADTEVLLAKIQSALNEKFPNTSIFLQGVETEEDIQKLFLQPVGPKEFWAGILFPNGTNENNWQYEILMPSSLIPSASSLYVDQQECRTKNDGKFTSCDAFSYFQSGFLDLQDAIDTVILESKSNVSEQRTVYTKLAPKAAFVFPGTIAPKIYPLYLVIAFSPFVQFLVIRLISEKEKKLRQGMEIMGLKDTVYMASYYVVYAAIIGLVSIVMLCMGLAGSGVWKHSNKLIIFMLLYFYGLSTIGISFIMSSFLNNTRAATTVATLLLMILSVLNIALQEGVPNGVCWLLSIFSPLGFSLSISGVLLLEAGGTGVQWHNVNQIAGVSSVAMSLVMLAVDMVLYALLGWYLGRVVPSEYGITQPWYFPFQRLFRRNSNNIADTLFMDEERDVAESESVEKLPKEYQRKPVTIDIRNLTKEFKATKTPAVDHLSMRVYEGEIFALLGHNGAGKTTTISILTGLMNATSGTALVNGFDITTNMRQIRNSIGLCPQHDLLFDDLTVKEHLEFYGELKGITGEKLVSEVDALLKKVGLEEKKTTLSKSLSGGMKRKLSLAIALVGDPKVLFLDEPTSGMDPYSRRKVWELLNESKKGRTIILTTHYMDEAEYLSDRVAIMSKGSLRCLGSTLFLKNRFGVNYYLNIEKLEGCDTKHIAEIVTKNIDNSQMTEENSSEIIFSLPLKNVKQFPKLFRKLETKRESLHIASFGVTLTTLEEVFLKLAAQEAETDEADTKEELVTLHDQPAIAPIAEMPYRTEAPHPTFASQTAALASIKLKQFVRKPASVFCGIVIPIILVFIGCLVAFLQRDKGTSSPISVVHLNGDLYSGGLGRSFPAVNATGGLLPPNIAETSPGMMFVDGITSASEFETYLSEHPDHIGGLYIDDWQAAAVNVTFTFNDTAVHSLPLLMNVLTNAQLKQFGANVSMSIKSLEKESLNFDVSRFAATFLIGFSIIFTPVQFTAALVRDCKVKFKRQLAMMGMKVGAYWCSAFLTDSLFFTCISVSTFIIVLGFKTTFAGTAFGAFAVVIILSQLSMLLFSYLLSFAFADPDSVFRVLTIVYQFAAMIPAIAVMVMSVISDHSREISTYIHYAACAIDPPYTLMGTLNYISLFGPLWQITHPGQGNPTSGDYFKESTIYVPMLCSIGHVVLFSAVIFYMDFYRYWRQWSLVSDRNPPDSEQTDEDVLEEVKRVDGAIDNNSVVVVKHLHKKFIQDTRSLKEKLMQEGKAQHVTAVADLCLKIKLGECFGLLGPNGAGKSTSLSMLVGDQAPTSGTALIDGYDLKKQLEKTYEVSGFCPQVDPYPDDLTGHELLVLFARIKGFSPADAAVLSREISGAIGITRYQNQKTKGYSGGTKRKLSVALSLVSSPKVVYLDEPSAGIDPASRRFLWTVIKSHMDTRSTILTTHSMEEAQALCSRIGIMVNGNMQCLGSSQHLKHRFGTGYSLEIKSYENLEEVIKQTFGCELDESVNGHQKYHLGKSDISISEIFNSLIELTSKYPIEDYAVSQASLEQVFINFAKKQVERE
eukprot:TRINITY_DN3066_c0_g1_i2.p1 TRINITY_DN3066_c0_g1~~TRINITY_DN3066_c0_g1_i2.p1  ORF type:complete len:1610 (-),score=443.90 TRINITY_DN3066_c0_g1_i2:33-4862(-)